MFRRAMVCQAVALALALPAAARAFDIGESVSVSGYVKNETAVFTEGGQTTGLARSTIDDREYDGGQIMKFENSARFFLTGDLAENTSWAADINLIYDSEGTPNDYKGYMLYSSHDYLRELYIDTKLSDWQFRVGKQQVVWGTADGIKLLDIINPTDWREFNQNTFEDSRIPIWMVKAEKNLTERSNIQFIVAQHEENKIPGLNNEGDWGNPFLFKGIDTITGPVNGFRSIAPKLGDTASAFERMAEASGFVGLHRAMFTTVENFIKQPAGGAAAIFGGLACRSFTPFGVPAPFSFTNADTQAELDFNAQCLKRIAELPESYRGFPAPLADPKTVGGSNQLVTNLQDVSWSADAEPNSAFEYMPFATFATFNTFTDINTKYVRDYPDTLDPNLGFRWKNTTAGGFSFSLNYFYAYDPNPSVSIHWENASGEKLSVEKVTAAQAKAVLPPGSIAELGPEAAQAQATTILLKDSANRTYGTFDGDPTLPDGTANPNFGQPGAGPATLVFEETVHRIHNIGGAFDMSIDNLPMPVVVRGELLYQKDTRLPVIDRGELAIGNLTGALRSERADQFKYVIGVDVTVLTNLFISGQFIQFINLDYVDEGSDAWEGYKRYTGDLPVLHLDNQLQKAEEFKEFYSLFFSKPFGPSQEHRWNNITIYEEGDGWWNRFDVEYTFTDNLIGSAELNLYWGDENTLFGQFENSSNFQVGLKYLF